MVSMKYHTKAAAPAPKIPPPETKLSKCQNFKNMFIAIEIIYFY